MTSVQLPSTEQIRTLHSALEDVPVTLLDLETARVLGGVLSSLDIVERARADRPVVVLVGPTGAGKSFLFNAIVGADASPEGALRPTTSSVVIAGEPTLGLRQQVPDATVLQNFDIGFTLVDMPAWDGTPESATRVPAADLVVLVVSPIRYADASVAALWASLDPERTLVVLNRVATTREETSDLLASVSDMFGTEPYVISQNDSPGSAISDHIANQIPISRTDVVASIMVRSAGTGARFIVREVTSAAPTLGKVSSAVDGITDCSADVSQYDVQVSWEGTRDAIIERFAIDVRDRDDTIVRTSDTDLAERTLELIGPWADGEDMISDLDTWHDRCISAFSDAATIRWRRSSTRQLIDRFSWSTSINQDIVAPKRFVRVLGERLDGVRDQMRTDLESLICSYLDARLETWRSTLDGLGDYKPGALASAADGFDSVRPGRD
ncbi:MAG: 50S ribosome-binding GTPase [Actinomycetia bacterium]|nr:50S ribosome-binding GTPase [Actinomycetes bacterium]